MKIASVVGVPTNHGYEKPCGVKVFCGKIL